MSDVTLFLQAVRERLKKATPGIWEHTPHRVTTRASLKIEPDWTRWFERDEDADLIAHAPTDLAKLLALVEAGERVVKAAGENGAMGYWEPPCKDMNCDKGYHVDHYKAWTQLRDALTHYTAACQEATKD